MRKLILILFLILNLIHAQENEDNNTQEEQMTELQKKEQLNRNTGGKDLTKAKVIKTYKDATGNEKIKNWNNKDWEANMRRNGNMDTGSIAKSQSFFKSIKGSDNAFSGNPNEMNTQKLQEDDSLKDVKSVNAFDKKLENSIIAANNKRTTAKLKIQETIKCYITRDIPIKYRCEKTGLVYGGAINSDGKSAKVSCDSECYEQYSCIDVNPTALETYKSIKDIELTKESLFEEINETADINKTVKDITFTVSNDSDSKYIYLDVSYFDKEYIERKVYSKFFIKEKKEMKVLVGTHANAVKIKLYSKKKEDTAVITDIKINYKKDNKYVCPVLQDISTKNPADFAYVCPSGKIETFNVGSTSYTICADYGVIGENNDGTFNNLSSCKSVCKKNFECQLDKTSISSTTIQNFREGCIEGQTNCEKDTCKKLRISGNMILNENVFDAGFNMTKTIVNGTVTNAEKRPKMLLRDDIDFQIRNQEEWKDEAYSNMINEGTYKSTKMKLNEDTEVSQGFNIGIKENTIDSSTQGYYKRGLMWVLKPKSSDVENGTFRFYAILSVVTQKYEYNPDGTKFINKDKILYVKTSEDDIFKPFAIKRNFARNTVKNSVPMESSNITSKWSYEYFNTSLNKWFPTNSLNTLEHFKSSEIIMDNPYLRLQIINSMNNVMYAFPGILRSIKKSGPYETKIYDGKFDGSGQSIGRMGLYVYYTKDEVLTYKDVIERIENDELKMIYNNAGSNGYNQRVVSDTQEKESSIEIYAYGNTDKKTAFARIIPAKKDVGKKGFIFVFAK